MSWAQRVVSASEFVPGGGVPAFTPGVGVKVVTGPKPVPLSAVSEVAGEESARVRHEGPLERAPVFNSSRDFCSNGAQLNEGCNVAVKPAQGDAVVRDWSGVVSVGSPVAKEAMTRTPDTVNVAPSPGGSLLTAEIPSSVAVDVHGSMEVPFTPPGNPSPLKLMLAETPESAVSSVFPGVGSVGSDLEGPNEDLSQLALLTHSPQIKADVSPRSNSWASSSQVSGNSLSPLDAGTGLWGCDGDLLQGQDCDESFAHSGGGRRLTLQDLDVRCKLGEGGFGSVYQVCMRETGHVMAMKVMRKGVVLSNRKGVRSERAALEACKHPFIVTMHGAFQTHGKLYLVMDYVAGGQLLTHIQDRGPFSETDARFYLAEAAAAIGALHCRGIVHRDLKPENIMLDREGHICVTDFGCCAEGMDAERRNSHVGTHLYMSPEIVDREV